MDHPNTKPVPLHGNGLGQRYIEDNEQLVGVLGQGSSPVPGGLQAAYTTLRGYVSLMTGQVGLLGELQGKMDEVDSTVVKEALDALKKANTVLGRLIAKVCEQ